MSIEWTEAEREAMTEVVPHTGLHVMRCRCHVDGDPAATDRCIGDVDGLWYAPECVTAARSAHAQRKGRADRMLDALAPLVEARIRAERAAALEDAADDLGVLVDEQHPAALNPDPWLRDRADREASEPR